jgi:hypothetical protein
MGIQAMTRYLTYLIFGVVFVFAANGQNQNKVSPYRCEGDAQDAGQNLSEGEVRQKADSLSKGSTALEFCTSAELYKRVGDARAADFYQSAIDADKDEPVYELFYGDYYRVYRGAGQRPLFPKAEEHLLEASAKLAKRLKQAHLEKWPPCNPDTPNTWDPCTADRVQRSLTALYERDGIHLANRTTATDGTDGSKVDHPWLFLSPAARVARTTDDFDQTSDIRDLTSAALFSRNCLPAPVGRLCRSSNTAELAGLARIETPMEVDSTLRIRYGSAPVVDIYGAGRRTEDGTINSTSGYFTPDKFSNLKLLDFGLHLEKPFSIGGNTDADLQFSYDHVNRQGLIEFFPNATERIGQYTFYGSISKYLGPDRLNLSYTYVRQNINPMPHLTNRDRELMGGTIDYQIFRRLFSRSLNSGLGRYFETRGIDLIAGVLDDHDHYTGPNPNVITRRDYFIGIAAKGFKRIDVTVQPTWYSSRVNVDPTQYNAQFRLAGNLLYRIVDEERTPGVPKGRFLGLPVVFIQVVFPFHYDVPHADFKTFESRSIGGELSTKFFTDQKIGVTVLGVIGYSRDSFPLLNKDFNLGRIGVSIGF